MKKKTDVICDAMSITTDQKEGCYKEFYFRLIIINNNNKFSNDHIYSAKKGVPIARVFEQKLSNGMSESRRNEMKAEFPKRI